jgi:hypothetical protein
MALYKCRYKDCQKDFTRTDSLRRHENNHPRTPEDATPQLSLRDAPPEPPRDGLLTPESISYSQMPLKAFQYATTTQVGVPEDKDSTISRIENLEDAIYGMYHDIQGLMDRMAKLECMESP